MKQFALRVAVLLGFGIVGLVPVQAQHAPTDVVETVWAAYQRLEYDTAEALALDALDALDPFSPAQLSEFNVVLALINYARNETARAHDYFLSALSLTPDLTLDPLLVSPKALAFFEEVKSEQRTAQPPETTEAAAPRYVLVHDPRPAAALRSMVAPGWGQLYKDEPVKGRVLLGAWSVAAGGTLAAHLARGSAKTRYLDETDPDLIEQRYDRYNRWHKVRGGLALGAAAIWLYSYVDALASGPPQAPGRQRLTVMPVPETRAVRVSVRWRL